MAKELVKAAMAKAGALTVTTENFPVLVEESRGEILEAIQANLGGSQMNTFSLDRINVPSGAQPFFTVRSIDDTEGSAEKFLDGIIIGHRENRGYWAKGLDEGGAGTPPDCSSDDGKFGVGNPGGVCKTCPKAQFNTAIKKDGSPGRGQACKASHLLFLLREGLALPNVVVVPASSLKYLEKYMMRLASTASPYYGVTTRISLKPDKNEDGIDFVRMEFERTGKLDAETRINVQKYADVLTPILKAVRIDESIEAEKVVSVSVGVSGDDAEKIAAAAAVVGTPIDTTATTVK